MLDIQVNPSQEVLCTTKLNLNQKARKRQEMAKRNTINQIRFVALLWSDREQARVITGDILLLIYQKKLRHRPAYSLRFVYAFK